MKMADKDVCKYCGEPAPNGTTVEGRRAHPVCVEMHQEKLLNRESK